MKKLKSKSGKDQIDKSREIKESEIKSEANKSRNDSISMPTNSEVIPDPSYAKPPSFVSERIDSLVETGDSKSITATEYRDSISDFVPKQVESETINEIIQPTNTDAASLFQNYDVISEQVNVNEDEISPVNVVETSNPIEKAQVFLVQEQQEANSKVTSPGAEVNMQEDLNPETSVIQDSLSNEDRKESGEQTDLSESREDSTISTNQIQDIPREAKILPETNLSVSNKIDFKSSTLLTTSPSKVENAFMESMQRIKASPTKDQIGSLRKRIEEMELVVEDERNLRSVIQREAQSLRNTVDLLTSELSEEKRKNKDLLERNQQAFTQRLETSQKDLNSNVVKELTNKIKQLEARWAEEQVNRQDHQIIRPEAKEVSTAANEIVKLEHLILKLKQENENLKKDGSQDWKGRYIESCVKLTELIKEKRTLLYEIDDLRSKAEKKQSCINEDVDLLVRRINWLESRNKNLVKVVAKLTSINWHQEEIISKLSGPKIKLPESIEQIRINSDTKGFWTLSSDPNKTEASIPEDLISLIYDDRTENSFIVNQTNKI